MPSISSIMDTALSGLRTQRILIDMTSGNISNVNTEGYSRRVAVLKATQTSSSSGEYTGIGVAVEVIKRVTDSFTIKQLNSAAEDCGELEAELKYLECIEAIFDESEGMGFSDALSDLFNAWQVLANDASDAHKRSILLSKAQTLASTLNEMYTDLREIQIEINNDISSTVDEINSLTEQIANLNQKIQKAEGAGISTNSYKDSRDSLITELSSLIDINYSENDDGQVYIQLSNGKSLVRGTSSWSLGTETNASTGLQDVTWVDSNGDEDVITGNISGGELGGAIDIRDQVIVEYMDSLDELASEIISRVNSLHTSGYDINGDAGLDFFTGTSAADMAVNEDILGDTNLIAAASTSDGAPGDGTIANSIALLQDSPLMKSGTTTFAEYYSGMVGDIGTRVEDTKSSYGYQSDLVEFYNNYRESISGVSSDEELANLVLYQNTYEACARVISVLDELLQTIINM